PTLSLTQVRFAFIKLPRTLAVPPDRLLSFGEPSMITSVMPTYARADIEMVRGEGCYMFDSKGRKYLDFAAGIAVNAFGHGHPHLVDALKRQADLLWHTSNLYRVPGQERVSQRLREATFADTMFFTNSGAEAVECAIKTCRRHPAAQGRPEKIGRAPRR